MVAMPVSWNSLQILFEALQADITMKIKIIISILAHGKIWYLSCLMN